MQPRSSHQETDCKQCCRPKAKHCCDVTYRRNKIIEYVSYDEWLPNVRIQAREIPDSILLDYIRRGCIEFAQASKMLVRNISLNLEPCVADYYPCLGDNERIDRVRLLSVNGGCYESVGDTCSWDVGSHKFWFHPPASLEIHPAPLKNKNGSCNLGEQMIFTVVAVPTEDSDVVDKMIYDRHFEAIEHYAVAKTRLIPEKSDNKASRAEQAADFRFKTSEFNYHMEAYRRALNRAKIDYARNYSSDLSSKEGINGCLS